MAKTNGHHINNAELSSISSDEPATNTPAQLRTPHVPLSDAITRTDSIKSEIRSDVSGFHEFDEEAAYAGVDQYEKSRNESSIRLHLMCTRTLDLLGRFPGGVNIHSFQQQFYSDYKETFKFGSYARSAYHFFKDKLGTQVKMVQKSGSSIVEQEGNNRDKQVIMLSAFLHLQNVYGRTHTDGSLKKQLELKIKNMKELLIRVRFIVNKHQGGLFVDEVEKVYEQIYAEKFDINQYQMTIELLLDQLATVSVHKSYVYPTRKYVQRKRIIVDCPIEEISPTSDHISHIEPITQYFQRMDTGTEDTNSRIINMLKTLAGQAVPAIPVRELGPIYQTYWKTPFIPNAKDEYAELSNIDLRSKIRITENYHFGVGGRQTTVFWLNQDNGTVLHKMRTTRFQPEKDLEREEGETDLTVRICDIGSSNLVLYVSHANQYDSFKSMLNIMHKRLDTNTTRDLIGTMESLTLGMPIACKVFIFKV